MMSTFNAGSAAAKTTTGPVFTKRKAALKAGAFALGLLAATPIFAQSDEVLLQSEDGSVSITGKLIGANDEFFTVEGYLGVMQVPRSAVSCIGAGCPSEEVAEVAVVENRAVMLNSIDDETRISGELVSVEERFYILRNALGEFRIARDNVTCVGAACPVVNVYDSELAIYSASSKINDMLVDLLADYTQETGQMIEIADGTQSVKIFASDSQELIADIDLKVENPQAALSALSDRSADILVYGQHDIDGRVAAASGVSNLLEHPLAFDGHVIIGNSDNPVRDLNLGEIDSIWSRNITSWRSLGAGEFPIAIHMVENAAGTDSWLNGLQASRTQGAVLHQTEEQVIDAVNADRNALGLVNHAAASKMKSKMLAVRKVCGLTAEPSKFGIRTQHYPFTQALNSIGRGDSMHPFAQAFLEWMQTDGAAQRVANQGYTSALLQRTKIQDMGVAVVHTAAVEPDFDGLEFSTMMRELRSADRLSMTFTFLTGSTVLDDVSLLAAKDLARRLRSSEFEGQEVLLVGFADNTGPAAPNSALSLRRADTVREALAQEFDVAALGQLNLTSMGFGEQMPVDCNDTDTGRANNRRVEVWVRLKV